MKKWILIALSFALWLPSWQAQSQDGQKSENAGSCVTHTVTNETTKTSHTITRCLNDAVVNLKDKKPAPKDSEHKANKNPDLHGDPFGSFSDLDAQISMAESTDSIRSYTLAGIVVGTLGLFFLGWTLKATRNAARAANRTADAAENAERAHVFIDFDIEQIGEKPAKADQVWSDQIVIKPIIYNVGNTPASDVCFKIWRDDTENGEPNTFNPNTTRQDVVGFLGSGKDRGFPCGNLPVHSYSFDILGSLDLKFFAEWEYSDIFNKRRLVKISVEIGRELISGSAGFQFSRFNGVLTGASKNGVPAAGEEAVQLRAAMINIVGRITQKVIILERRIIPNKKKGE